MNNEEKMENKLLPELEAFVKTLDFTGIPAERKERLLELRHYIQEKIAKNHPVNLTFICTHNSRRSQLAQVWAQTAAFYFKLDRLKSYSGGTEATAFHPNALQALETAGFAVSSEEGGSNPRYLVSYSQNAEALPCFSKRYDDPHNAKEVFAAVMTCSDADQNCPFIPHAEARFSIKYDDPKMADGTSREQAVYLERSRQIATEMFFVMGAQD